jgi:hypothetical protein
MKVIEALYVIEKYMLMYLNIYIFNAYVFKLFIVVNIFLTSKFIKY